MRQTWRWFGPKDLVSIDDMMQAGVQGVVSALHHVPTGAVWSPKEIARRQGEIARMTDGAPSGLEWEVVESLPVSEDIKKQKGDWREHIASYKTSLRHLRDAGIEVICYNFMPVLDWTRTDLKHLRPDGATAMRFDLVDFSAFDIHILARPGAAQGLPDGLVDAAHDLSEGGLAQAVVESCLRHDVGARVWLPEDLDPFVALFSESAGRTLVAVPRSEEVRFTDMCSARGFPSQRIGVTDGRGPDALLDVQDRFSVTLRELSAAWSATLPAALG